MNSRQLYGFQIPYIQDVINQPHSTSKYTKSGRARAALNLIYQNTKMPGDMTNLFFSVSISKRGVGEKFLRVIIPVKIMKEIRFLRFLSFGVGG